MGLVWVPWSFCSGQHWLPQHVPATQKAFTNPLTVGKENLVRIRVVAALKVYFNITFLSGKEKPEVACFYFVVLRLYGFTVSLLWC